MPNLDKENLENWEKRLETAGKHGDIIAATTNYFSYLHEHHQPYGNLAYRVVGDKKKFESTGSQHFPRDGSQHHEKCGFAPCASGRIGRMRRTGKESFNMTTGCN